MNKQELKQTIEHTIEVVLIILINTAWGVGVLILIDIIPKIINKLLLWQYVGLQALSYTLLTPIHYDMLSFHVHTLLILILCYKIGAIMLKDRLYFEGV